MSIKHHFKFNLTDAKQLSIAIISAGIPWACRGFAHDAATLWYTFGGFITGGLVSHNSEANPNVAPKSHINTPYVSNLNDLDSSVPDPVDMPSIPNGTTTNSSGYQNVKIITKNNA